MNFIKLNNNDEPKNITMESGYQSVYGNCQITKIQYKYDLKNEYCFVENFDSDQIVKDNKEAKMSGKPRVVVEKLPDSVVQQYLSKKVKNYEKMNFGIHSSLQNFVRINKTDNHIENFPPNRFFVKEQNFEADKFVKELCNPTMQQYLANTEMGCLTDDFEEIPDSLEHPAKAHNCTTDSLIENLSENVDVQYSVQMDRKYQDQFVNDLSYPNVQQPHVTFPITQELDIETLDHIANDVVQENLSKKNNIKKKRSSIRRRCRTNITTKLCQRICLDCHVYVQKAYKASDKVKCDTCKVLTSFECNACKKIANTYGGIADHLLYRCEARSLYKCAHCKYSVTKKQTLSWHIKRNHEKLILKYLLAQKRKKRTEKISNQSHSEHEKRFENLIVLKKQKEMECKSEWYIENVKRSDSKVNKSVDSSVSPKTISNLPLQNSPSSNSVKEMTQFYCEYCNKDAIDAPHNQTEISCRTCGTVLLFKCVKCRITCGSYQSMQHHLRKLCNFKENNREIFRCSECNYKSFFQGLVINHRYKMHNFDQSKQFCTDNSIKNYSQNY